MIIRIKHITLFALLLCGLGLPRVQATHLIGGYMSYEFLRTEANNDKTFKISLTLFRDIENSTVDFDQIQIGVYLNNAERTRNQIITTDVLKRQLVRPPGNEECDYYSNKRIEMGYYETVVTLAPYPQGYHIYFVRCCRNFQDNLVDNGTEPTQGQTYYCFIPNPALENSSPFFSGIPSPYMCNNDSNTFLNRAIDPDGDSLVYRIVHPYQGGAIGQNASAPVPPSKLPLPIETVVYRNNFDYTFPFGKDGVSTVNKSTGLTTLLATKPGSYVIAIEVEEYRNGMLLSRVRLDMQILVLDCPPNKKPKGSNERGKYMEIEAGEPLCIKVQGVDPDDNPPQNVTVFGTGDILTGQNGFKPPLATMKTVKAQKQAQTELCWTPDCDQARDEPYTVSFTFRDDGCPSKQEIYDIQIKVNKFIGANAITGPTKVCASSSYTYDFEVVNPKSTSSFWWDLDKGAILGPANESKVTMGFDGSGFATIRMVEISQFGCPGDTVEYVVELIPTPDLPIISGKDTVCLNEANVTYTVPNNATSTYRWIHPDGSIGTSTTSSTSYTWNQLGDFVLAVVETNENGCRSDTGKIEVNVRKPAPDLNGVFSVCPNASGVEYTAIGHPNSTFNWLITRGVQASGGNTKDVTIDWGEEGQGRIVLTETDKWQCVSDPTVFLIDLTYDLAGLEPIGDESVCEFDANVPYMVQNANGSVYLWTISGGNQVLGDSTNNIEVTWGPTGNGSVTVQQTAYDPVNQKVCQSPPQTLDVVINPLPTADEIEGEVDFCETDEEKIYTINGFAGSTYEWKINGSSAGINGQGTNQITVVWTGFGTFDLEVVELTKDSCPGEIIDTTIVIHPKPISDKIEGDFLLCFPDVKQAVYRISGYNNSTYSWAVTNGTFTNSTADSIVVDWNDSGYGNVSVVEISEFGCIGDTVNLPIYINNIEIDLDRVSVGFPDDRVHSEWSLVNDDLTSSPFLVQSRLFGVEVAWNNTNNEFYTNHTDYDVNTDNYPIEYRVQVTDLCGNIRTSEVHRTILLTGNQDPEDYSVNLEFTPYIGWDNGVSYYEVYKSVNKQPLTFAGQVVQGETIVFPSDRKAFQQCYRIKAYELDGKNKSSWSNEICFYFSPNVYVPTAFTPNQDNLNETFHPVSVAVQTYELAIYNRWGEKIFLTNNQEEGWDGTYGGVNSPSGIYMYIIKFTDAENKAYSLSGTVQLMR